MSKVSVSMMFLVDSFLDDDHTVCCLIQIDCRDLFVTVLVNVDINFFSVEEAIIDFDTFYCLTDYFSFFIILDVFHEIKLAIVWLMQVISVRLSYQKQRSVLNLRFFMLTPAVEPAPMLHEDDEFVLNIMRFLCNACRCS